MTEDAKRKMIGDLLTSWYEDDARKIDVFITIETSCSGGPSELFLEFSSASNCSTQLLVDSAGLVVMEGAEFFSFSFFIRSGPLSSWSSGHLALLK